MCMNKAVASHVGALACIVVGYVMHVPMLYDIGLFAMAGSITNELATFMLFEKVPGLYGSGVIPMRFEEFKQGIFDLIMGQFFNPTHLDRFFNAQEKVVLEFNDMIESLDLNNTFDAFVNLILNSQMGGMLSMIGGAKLLESFRESFMEKLKEEMIVISQGELFQEAIQRKMREALNSDIVHAKVANLVTQRLDELTPRMVKEIVAAMIKKHLGWLVVWGAVFGGLMGMCANLIHLLQGTV